MPKKSIYLTDQNIASLLPGNNESMSLSGRVNYFVSVANQSHAESMPELSVNEWCAICDANNGTAWEYERGINALLSGMVMNVADSAPDLNDQWSLDCLALARKLDSMKATEKAAIFEIVQKFWSEAGNTKPGEACSEVFTQLGARLSHE